MSPSKKAVNYRFIIYYNSLRRKPDNILNNNNGHVKIAFKTYNKPIKIVCYDIEKIKNNSFVNFNSIKLLFLIII